METVPMISIIIANILGLPPRQTEWSDNHQKTFNHFLNWLACFHQTKVRSKVAWEFYGVEDSVIQIFQFLVLNETCETNISDRIAPFTGNHLVENYHFKMPYLILCDLPQSELFRRKITKDIQNLTRKDYVYDKNVFDINPSSHKMKFNLLICSTFEHPLKSDKDDTPFNQTKVHSRMIHYLHDATFFVKRMLFDDFQSEVKRESSDFIKILDSFPIDLNAYNQILNTQEGES